MYVTPHRVCTPQNVSLPPPPRVSGHVSITCVVSVRRVTARVALPPRLPPPVGSRFSGLEGREAPLTCVSKA